MKRYEFFIDNHGAWHGKQDLKPFERSNGEWIKVSDLVKHLKSIDITSIGTLAEIDTQTNKTA
jgi:hypothetical protein